MATPQTTRRILAAALRLFTRHGSGSVTTHDIAQACGLSPGNLYYHYRNKEAIVRALFDEALDSHRRHEAAKAAGTAVDDEAFLKAFNWRYRFFKRELPTLLQRDPVLRRRFQAFQRAHLRALDEAVCQAARQGRLPALDAGSRGTLVEVAWMIALFWPSFVEVSGQPLTRANVDRGADVLTVLLGLIGRGRP